MNSSMRRAVAPPRSSRRVLTVHLDVMISPELQRRLVERAAREHRCLSSLVRHAVDEYLGVPNMR